MANATTKGGNPGDHARHEAGQAASKGQDALSHAGQAVSSAASAVGQTVGNAASSVGSSLSGAASAVGQRADDLAGRAGQGVQSLASTVREQGPREGYLGQATGAVASGLEQAGKYLESNQLSGMTGDFGGLIKAHPIPAVLIGLGVGFLLGRALRD